MQILTPFLTVVAVMTAPAAFAQTTDGVGSVMAACDPIAATGTTIRADMIAAGWLAQSPQAASQALRDLIGSQMWSFAPDASSQEQENLMEQYVPALTASLNDPDFGQLYTRTGEVSVILSQGENLSCLWVGPQTDSFDAQAIDVGGLPDIEGLNFVTAGRNQTVEAGGRDWLRNLNFATLEEGHRFGPYPAAARLDRSPVQ